MQKIFSSATKVTLLMLVLTLCVSVFMGLVTEDTFKTALLMVFSFYFGQKTPPTEDTKLQA